MSNPKELNRRLVAFSARMIESDELTVDHAALRSYLNTTEKSILPRDAKQILADEGVKSKKLRNQQRICFTKIAEVRKIEPIINLNQLLKRMVIVTNLDGNNPVRGKVINDAKGWQAPWKSNKPGTISQVIQILRDDKSIEIIIIGTCRIRVLPAEESEESEELELELEEDE